MSRDREARLNYGLLFTPVSPASHFLSNDVDDDTRDLRRGAPIRHETSERERPAQFHNHNFHTVRANSIRDKGHKPRSHSATLG